MPPGATSGGLRGRCAARWIAILGWLAACPRLVAQSEVPQGPFYPVSSIEIRYRREHADHPPIEAIMALQIELGDAPEGLVAPAPQVPLVRLAPADVAARPPRPWSAGAIQTLLEAVRDHLLDEGLMGIFVGPDPAHIDGTGRDLRPPGQGALRILITTAVVSELRTLAAGERIERQERVNHPLHRRIREQSPIQPYYGLADEQKDLLHKPALDRYLFHLNRHPGRRVDAAVAPAEAGAGEGDAGATALDYIVTENRPLMLFAEVSNTGTEATERTRLRFGLLHTQLTNHDDLLELTFETAEFGDTNQFLGGYEAPFPGNDRLRWRLNGSWNEFTAADVGVASDAFTGESWWIGAELVANVFQRRELFVDLFASVRYLDSEVMGALGTGQEGFFMPGVGARLDSSSELASTFAAVALDWQSGWVTSVDASGLDLLGRSALDEDWAVLSFTVRQSLFLEPLLERSAFEDVSGTRASTLAHEVLAVFRGQYAFGRRLIPELEQPLGGMFTVRGYPESVVAGDNVYLGSLEYRLHLPRVFAVEPEPRRLFGQAFRFAPQHVYGLTDWDLLLKGFLDVGRSEVSGPQQPGESDETLIGAGVGLEFLYRRNLRVRLDWGFVLEEIESRDVNSGSNRLHVLASILF